MKTRKRVFWPLALLMALVLMLFGAWDTAFARGGGRGGGGGGRGGGAPGGGGGRGGSRGGSRGGRGGGGGTQSTASRKKEQERLRREERVRRVGAARIIYAKRERQLIWDAESTMADGVSLGKIFDGMTG